MTNSCGRIITDLVGAAIGVPVGVTVEAGHAAGRRLAAASSLVELLLRKGRDEQAQPSRSFGFRIPLNSS